jgi:hypothetical protein
VTTTSQVIVTRAIGADDRSMTDITNIIDEYFAAWNETDAARRGERSCSVWTETGRYVDPLSDTTGPDEFAAMAGAVQQQFPGVTLRRTSAIDAHHDQARFAWAGVDEDGTVVLAGIDVAVIAPDGRLAAISGFFGDTEAVAA